MKQLVILLLMVFSGAASAVGWRNVDEEHHLGGRKASVGYLQGKIVLVDKWGYNCSPCRAKLKQIESIWQSFKTKPFVVLGGHCSGWGAAEEVRSLIQREGLTYPIYEDAGLATDEPAFDAIPFIYVVDETGRIIYRGRNDRAATQAVVTALTDLESPRDLRQWKRFVDYELAHLPGRAYLRLAEFRRLYPDAAEEYDDAYRALSKRPEVVRLSELVAFSKKAKDMRVFGPSKEQLKAKFAATIAEALVKYGSLKGDPDPLVAQEAKNSLADLKWTKATL